MSRSVQQCQHPPDLDGPIRAAADEDAGVEGIPAHGVHGHVVALIALDVLAVVLLGIAVQRTLFRADHKQMRQSAHSDALLDSPRRWYAAPDLGLMSKHVPPPRPMSASSSAAGLVMRRAGDRASLSSATSSLASSFLRTIQFVTRPSSEMLCGGRAVKTDHDTGGRAG